MLKRNKQSGPPLSSLLFFLFFFFACVEPLLEKPISLQTASYLGMCLCLVICTPIHILNRILFTLMQGHLLFFRLSWKRGISCWLVERNFLVNKVTINSSKHVFLEPCIYKIGNKAELLALRSPKRCRAEKKKPGSLKANWANIFFFFFLFCNSCTWKSSCVFQGRYDCAHRDLRSRHCCLLCSHRMLAGGSPSGFLCFPWD